MGSPATSLLAALLGVAAASAAVSPATTTAREVRGPDGALRGEVVRPQGRLGPAHLRLLGVPYAAPPVGALRWQPTRRHKGWSGTRDATAYGPSCPQGPWSRNASVMGEDCLYLNVWIPLHQKGPVPVMVWIHGGSFNWGSGSDYDGGALMGSSAVEAAAVVTINYRLSAIGYLGGAAVARSTRDGSAGNFAVQDVRAALEWVHRAAAELGLDARRVTLYGESAGSSMVAASLVAPRSAGLFHRAIMQSGPFDNYTMQGDCDYYFRTFAAQAGCGDADSPAAADAALRCLRGKSLQEMGDAISSASFNSFFSPCVDGVEFNGTTEELASLGLINPVDAVIVGTAESEGNLLMPFYNPVPGAPATTKSQFESWVQGLYPDQHPEEIVKQYDASRFDGDWWRAAAAVYTHSQYTCPTRRSARWIAKSTTPNVYTYRLTYAEKSMQWEGMLLFYFEWCRTWWPCLNATKERIGVSHSADIPFVWNETAGFSGSSADVSRLMVDSWRGLARFGSPGPAGASLQNATLGAGVTSIDWRAKGAVTPVKNQGSCGDCWSFSATGAIEGAWKIAGHELPSLSEQELTSCDKNDNGCNGGLMDRAFQWLLDNTKGAIATEASYPFESGDGTSPQCDGHGTTGATITGYSSVLSTEAGIAAELQHGPVSIAVDASDWQHYTGGVLECSTNTQIDHGVLAVGLGKDSTGAYWIVKNSWTAAWGEDGFVRVRYGIGSCLIGEYGVRPKV